MDYTITLNGGAAVMSYDKTTDIRNNLYLSLAIKKGSWWAAPEFGLRDRGRMKITEQSLRLLRGDCLEALQWLLDSGRAKSVEVLVMRDDQVMNRVRIGVEAVQADGRKVTIDKFIEVV